MTNKKVKLIKPDHKYTTPVKLAMEALERENHDYRR